jgi:N-acetylglucosamine kinase-like BadF-type ATPase
MIEQVFLGIDGGQTSTLAVICNQTGKLLGIGRGGPSNHISEPGGLDRLQSALRDSIQDACLHAGIDLGSHFPSFKAICCGMTGGIEFVPGFVDQIATSEILLVHYDLTTTHTGALIGLPGVIVIAGTGSVAYGVNALGHEARSGGWAYLMGDEGSGYDIGRQALIAAARAEDGRGPDTLLLPGVISFYNQKTLWDVRMQIYAHSIDRPQIAQLSRLVFKAAGQDDAAALAILDHAGRDLAEIALAVMNRLNLLLENTLVAPVGGLFQPGSALFDLFSHYLQVGAPLATIVAPIYPPVLGAVLLALKAGGVAIDISLQKQLKFAAKLLWTK